MSYSKDHIAIIFDWVLCTFPEILFIHRNILKPISIGLASQWKNLKILTPLQQTTLENIVTKREIAQNKQFLFLLKCFQLLLFIELSFKEKLQYMFAVMRFHLFNIHPKRQRNMFKSEMERCSNKYHWRPTVAYLNISERLSSLIREEVSYRF